MRLLLGVFVVSLMGCSERVDRWPGDGCQPACVIIDTEGTNEQDLRAVCLTPGEEVGACAEMGLNTVVCENEGDIPTCDTEDGKPRCLGGPVERPICAP